MGLEKFAYVELHDPNVSPNTTEIMKSTIRDLWAVWQVWGTGELHREFW